MNGNDLMNALSGLDPKFIDEAAFELHGKPEAMNEPGSDAVFGPAGKQELSGRAEPGGRTGNAELYEMPGSDAVFGPAGKQELSGSAGSDGRTGRAEQREIPGSAPERRKKAAITSFRKHLLIALPAAAAVLLTLAVAMPAIIRMNKGSYSTAPAPMTGGADTAPSFRAEESAAPSYDAAESAAPSYEAEEPAIPSSSAAESAAPSYDAEGAAEAYISAGSEKADSSGKADGSMATEEANGNAAEAPDTAWALTGATYYEGYLILHTHGELPEDPTGLTYTVRAADNSETVLAEGDLGDIMISSGPLTLDLTALELSDGTYYLAIADRSIEFTVPE